jgi:hypothetical protein
VGDVVEVFDIDLETGQGRIAGFDGTQIAFGLMLAFLTSRQALLAENAGDGADRRLELELAFEAAGAESGRAATGSAAASQTTSLRHESPRRTSHDP